MNLNRFQDDDDDDDADDDYERESIFNDQVGDTPIQSLENAFNWTQHENAKFLTLSTFSFEPNFGSIFMSGPSTARTSMKAAATRDADIGCSVTRLGEILPVWPNS